MEESIEQSIMDDFMPNGRGDSEQEGVNMIPELIVGLSEDPNKISNLAEIVSKSHFEFGVGDAILFLRFALEKYDEIEEAEFRNCVELVIREVLNCNRNSNTFDLVNDETFINEISQKFPDSYVTVIIFRELLLNIGAMGSNKLFKIITATDLIEKTTNLENVCVASIILGAVCYAIRNVYKGRVDGMGEQISRLFSKVLEYALTVEDPNICKQTLFNIRYCFFFPEFGEAFLKDPNLPEFLQRFPPEEIGRDISVIVENIFVRESSRKDKNGGYCEYEAIKNKVQYEETPIFDYFIELVKNDNESILNNAVIALSELVIYEELIGTLFEQGFFDWATKKVYEEGINPVLRDNVLSLVCSLFMNGSEEQVGRLMELGFPNILENLFSRQKSSRTIMIMLEACKKLSQLFPDDFYGNEKLINEIEKIAVNVNCVKEPYYEYPFSEFALDILAKNPRLD